MLLTIIGVAGTVCSCTIRKLRMAPLGSIVVAFDICVYETLLVHHQMIVAFIDMKH